MGPAPVSRGRAVRSLDLVLLLCLSAPCLWGCLDAASAGAGDFREVETPAGPESQESEAEPEAEEDETQLLRERLTEREDELYVEDPWTIEIFGHPLSVSGEYEFGLAAIRRWGLGQPDGDFDRLLLDQQLELESFYTLGRQLSFFAQFSLQMEEDLWSQVPEQVSDLYVERGETWIYAEDILGSHFDFDIGRLDFEDDRRWWWDEDLDAVRLAYETNTAEVVVALARELASDRSDRGYVDPEWERVLQVLVEASWDYAAEHAVELFGVYHEDHSPTGTDDTLVHRNREDESDATLTWLGARAGGAWQTGSAGIFGYWLAAAGVWGKETLIEYEELGSDSLIEGHRRHHVTGWAIDAGSTWVLPFPFEPRLTVGYAFGSGDPRSDEGGDRSFRQTGLQTNEAAFGGVETFPTYGVLLDPELSNLHIATLGAGVSLFRSSSVDLVYHYYRLVEPATSLRDSELDPELTGRHRALGHGIDLIVGIEELQYFQVELWGSLFRAGRAFADDRGEWAYGTLLVLKLAF